MLGGQLGAQPGGSATVVVSDVREELVGYVNGQPYLRRELEMPSAALHHAGEPYSCIKGSGLSRQGFGVPALGMPRGCAMQASLPRSAKLH